MKEDKDSKKVEIKLTPAEKRVKRKLFFGLIVISVLVTVIYLGLVTYQRKIADSENITLTVDEIEEYSEEEYNKDTFNVDFDTLSKEDKEKYDNINSMKLNLYELNQERIKSDIMTLLNVDTEDDNSKARLNLKYDENFYDNYMSNFEDYKIPNLEELDIHYAGVSFDNDVVCKYFVICSAISNEGNNFYSLRINIDYRNGVLTRFSVNKQEG